MSPALEAAITRLSKYAEQAQVPQILLNLVKEVCHAAEATANNQQPAQAGSGPTGSSSELVLDEFSKELDSKGYKILSITITPK